MLQIRRLTRINFKYLIFYLQNLNGRQRGEVGMILYLEYHILSTAQNKMADNFDSMYYSPQICLSEHCKMYPIFKSNETQL